MSNRDKTFEWPCDRREAHAPHVRIGQDDCPGVLAHPATMIGGGYGSW